jgi:mRNA-degrading endonuclease RelE of RelBE toxin-antitoxin system
MGLNKKKKTKKGQGAAPTKPEEKRERSGYKIEQVPAVRRDLSKLDEAERQAYFDWAKSMETCPNMATAQGVKRLRHMSTFPLWRRRLGDVRVIFSFEKNTHTLRILEVTQRGEDTYDDLQRLQKEAKKEAKKEASESAQPDGESKKK